MNPSKRKARDRVKGFIQHGFKLLSATGSHARGVCPFCGATKKHKDPFHIRMTKLLWDCKSCGAKGNFPRFLTVMAKKHARNFRGSIAFALAKDRGLSISVLKEIGVGYSEERQCYTIPFLKDERVQQIQFYKLTTHGDFNTTGGKRGYIVLGEDRFAKSAWIVEGPWDVGALRSALIGAKSTDMVVGIQGALSGQGPGLTDLVQGKNTVLVFDQDKAGFEADEKAREMLQGRVPELMSVHWPEDAKERYDVRDLWLTSKRKPHEFMKRLKALISEKARVPPTRTPDGKIKKEVGVVGKPTTTPRRPVDPEGKGIPRDKVIEMYREWLFLPNTDVLDVLFGTVFANRLGGEPLWLFLVGPSGCGKTELIMSLVDGPLIYPISSLTPQALVSGRNGPGGKDPSILKQVDGQLVTVKDFTTILSLKPDTQNEIFGILRESYDGRYERRYGGNVDHRIYICRFGILACVTPIIEQLGPTHSLVGERFVKYRMRDSCAVNAGSRMVRTAAEEVDKNLEDQRRAALARIGAEVINRPIADEHRPRLSKTMISRIHGLSMWVENLRGSVIKDKYTGSILHKPVAGVATRLVKQMAKLAMGVAVFREKRIASVEEYPILVKIAKSSIPDLVEEVIKQTYLRRHGKEVTAAELSQWTGFPRSTIADTLQNLTMLGVIEKLSDGGGKAHRINPVIVNMMQPLGLYTSERRWKKVRERNGKR